MTDSRPNRPSPGGVSRDRSGVTRFIVGATLGYAVFATLWIFFSDQMLVAIGDPEQVASLSSAKGFAFVIVTAIALAIGLRHVALRATAAPAPSAAPRRPWPLLAVLILVAVSLTMIGSLVYRGGSEAVERQKLTELRTVAALKVDAISRWLGERRSNVRAFAHDSLVSDAIDTWLQRGELDGRSRVLGAMSGMRKSYGFTATQLLFADGTVIMSDGMPTLSKAQLAKAASAALSTGDIVLVDLYRPDAAAAVRLGLVASVTVPRRGASLGRTLVAVELTPEDFLDPLLTAWPTDEPTGEAVLVRREWSDIVYLSDLKDRPGTALQTRVPLTQATLPIAGLLLGQEATVTGTNYRGATVLAAGLPVPDTNWFLLTTIDESDAVRPVRRLIVLTAGISATAMVLALAIAMLVWQRQRLQGVLETMQQRAETAAAELRFQATFDQSLLGLAHLDLHGRWLRVNPRLCDLVGRGHDDLSASDPRALLRCDANLTLDACMQELLADRLNACQGERSYRRPDGLEVWLAMALTLVRAANGEPQFFVLAVEDVSERKAAEIALRERVDLHEYLAKIAKTVPGMIYSFKLHANGAVSMPYIAPSLAEIFHDITPAEAATDAGPIMARIHPKDAERVWDTIGRSAADLTMWNEEFRVHHPLRGDLWIEARSAPEREADGSTVWNGFLRDITERKQADVQLRQAAAVFGNTQEGVVITDLDGHIIRVNPAVCRITGYQEADLLGRSMATLQSGRHDHTFYENLWHNIAVAGFWQGEIWNRRKNGEVYPELLTISTVRDASGTLTNYVGTFTDITNLKQSELQLHRLAHHDALTGLPNRLLLLSRLDHAIERVQRHGGLGAVLFVDLDRFKNVNDSLGHPAGDELLIAVARRMRARLRDSDTLARLGGDEFVVVLEDVGSAQQAAGVAQELIDRISESFDLSGGNEVYIGASIGISLFPSDSVAGNELIQHADTALYVAKQAGKRTYRFYRAELTEAANNRLALEARLRRGLERGEMVVHYQPLVALDDERAVGVEALLRWNDPAHGLVYPDHFIPLAEETGLIVPLGEWVLREACRQFQAWRQAGLQLDTLAVNLSPKQFQLPDLGDKVRTILAQTGLPPHCLELEITESALMHHGEETLAKLASLKQLGIRLAIDDFGTGYSSLAYLKRFPIDKLKIDKGFVHDVPTDAADCEITAAIISLAKNLKLEVLAEGVETAPQLAFLKSHGCDTAQGYLFARPAAAADIEPLLRTMGAGDTPGQLRAAALS